MPSVLERMSCSFHEALFAYRGQLTNEIVFDAGAKGLRLFRAATLTQA